FGQRWLTFRVDYFKRMGIDERFKVARRVWLGRGEKPVIKANFGVAGMRRAYPMDGTLDFAIGGCAARFTIQIDRATKLDHIARAIFNYLIALDDVGILKPYFTARFQAEVFR